jgi:hypothetical protein
MGMARFAHTLALAGGDPGHQLVPPGDDGEWHTSILYQHCTLNVIMVGLLRKD